MRVWRALKALGPAILRDGVYLLPSIPALREALEQLVHDVLQSGGQAFLFPIDVSADDDREFRALFDRSSELAELAQTIDLFTKIDVQRQTETEARRALRGLQKEFKVRVDIDHFPGRAQMDVRAALAGAMDAFERRFSPGEPHAAKREIVRLDPHAYRHRQWATREHLWVDRVASAWLIRRFIDPDARFLWLADTRACPAEAIGFDFDGAAFTHVNEAVTFEVLLFSFGLDSDPGLKSLAEMVRSLDVSGAFQRPEAAGFEALMAGAREHCATDDEFLAALSAPLSFLYAAFTRTAAR